MNGGHKPGFSVEYWDGKVVRIIKNCNPFAENGVQKGKFNFLRPDFRYLECQCFEK